MPTTNPPTLADLVIQPARGQLVPSDDAWQAVNELGTETGATYHPDTLNKYASGYVAALRGTQLNALDPDVFDRWYSDVTPLLQGRGNLGVWVTPHGTIEVEVSVVCDTLLKAAIVGATNDQQYVYSITDDEMTQTYGSNKYGWVPFAETVDERLINVLPSSWAMTA